MATMCLSIVSIEKNGEGIFMYSDPFLLYAVTLIVKVATIVDRKVQ